MPWLQNIYGKPYLSGSVYLQQKRYEVLSRFFSSKSVDETTSRTESRTTQPIVTCISFSELGTVFHGNMVVHVMLS